MERKTGLAQTVQEVPDHRLERFDASGGGANNKGVLLDLVLKIQEELVEDTKVGGSLGCSDHEMVEIRILHRVIRSTRTLNFQKANLSLFKDLFIGIPWVRAPGENGIQETSSIFKHHFLQDQDQCMPMCKKSGKGGRTLAWLSRELLVNLKWKKEAYGMWKKGKATWEDSKNIRV